MIKLLQILSEIKNISGTRPIFLGYRREGSNKISLITHPDYLFFPGEAILKNGELIIKTGSNREFIENEASKKRIPTNLLRITPGEKNNGWMTNKFNIITVPSKLLKIQSEYPKKEKLPKGEEVPLNLKIGKYNIDKGQNGYIIPWNEGRKYIDVRTLRRFDEIYDILNITPETIYISYDSPFPSTYCLGNYEGEPIVCAQRQTEMPMSGQFYVYSKYARLSATHPENGQLPDSRTTKEELLRRLRIPVANNA